MDYRRTHSHHPRIVLSEPADMQTAVIEARLLAAKAGFRRTEQVLIATAVSELATNILRYAGKGELSLRIVHDGTHVGVETLAVDAGPGIADVAQAMQDGFSTTKGSLGLGLSSVQRIMDEFRIDSAPGKGTRVHARKWVSAEDGDTSWQRAPGRPRLTGEPSVSG